MKRKPIEIKKKIMKILKEEGKLSFKKLERKVNTNYQSIKNNCEELEYFNIIEIKKTKENTENGQEYLIAEIKKEYYKNKKPEQN